MVSTGDGPTAGPKRFEVRAVTGLIAGGSEASWLEPPTMCGLDSLALFVCP